jgi:hypothetical protein
MLSAAASTAAACATSMSSNTTIRKVIHGTGFHHLARRAAGLQLAFKRVR